MMTNEERIDFLAGRILILLPAKQPLIYKCLTYLKSILPPYCFIYSSGIKYSLDSYRPRTNRANYVGLICLDNYDIYFYCATNIMDFDFARDKRIKTARKVEFFKKRRVVKCSQ